MKAQTLARVIDFCQHYKTERMNDIEKVISIYLLFLHYDFMYLYLSLS